MRILAGSKKTLDIDPRSFEDVLAAYLQELRVRNYGESSRDQASHVLPRFFAFLEERRVGDIRSVTEEHVVAWARHLTKLKTRREGEPFRAATRRTYLTLLQRFFRFLARRGSSSRIPCSTSSCRRCRSSRAWSSPACKPGA